jgi:predicted nucleic acid-binding protein
VIFVDTSFWVALQVPADAHHDAAVDLLREHAAVPLLATNHVRGETWTFLRRRARHHAAARFLDHIGDFAAAGFVELRPWLRGPAARP